MASSTTIHDPLETNLRQQLRLLLTLTSPTTPGAAELTRLSTLDDGNQILSSLSTLLAIPALTIPISTAFRPLLFDLCARWILEGQNRHEHLAALCILIEPYEQLYPILHRTLQNPVFQNGPLGSLPLDAPIPHLHRSLLAYYRLLQASRELPELFYWPLTPLSQIIWDPKYDTGSRLIAVRCYAIQSGMGEERRHQLETEILGEACVVDCPLFDGQTIEGIDKQVDGWILPFLEAQRIANAREEIASTAPDYFSDEEHKIPFSLCPLTANIHGILLLRSPGESLTSSPLIPTNTTITALHQLAIQVSSGLPTLLTSPPSSGKSLLITHLASILFPSIKNQVISIHLADTSLDPRSLFGSYVSSRTESGTFEWKEGVLVRAMRQGKWVVFEDIDRASSEVLGILKPLVESLKPAKWIGGRASLDIPGRGRVVAELDFALIATRSVVPTRDGAFVKPTFYAAHKFFEVTLDAPSPAEIFLIITSRYPRLSPAVARATIRLWNDVKQMGTTASSRSIGMRELEKFCSRIETVLPSSHNQAMDTSDDGDRTADTPFSVIFPNSSIREDIFLEARDVFFGAGALTAAARAHVDAIAACIAEHLGLDPDRRDWVLTGKTPPFDVQKDVTTGRVAAVHAGRMTLHAKATKLSINESKARPFAMHRPAIHLLSRISTAISLSEPLLLTGETGTGKTSAVTHLASLLRRPLISLNLSQQTESSDLIGGFKPIDTRMPASELQMEFLELFQGTFSRKKNAKFEEEVKKSLQDARWRRVVALWKEAGRMAKERIGKRCEEEQTEEPERGMDVDTPRKRRKVDREALNASRDQWNSFEKKVEEFEVHHVQGKAKFAFAFVEGPLVRAIRRGDWVLLDEINLASPETLECVSGLLSSPTSSITLTEQGSLEPVPRHPDFRLFACMNPATDVGKKDLPPNIRSRFTEIDVPPPDADKETLLSIIKQYIADTAQGDKASIMNVAEFYAAVKHLSETRQIADGSNHRPHYSMRTLARALTFAVDIAGAYGLRRAIWEGCLMAFTMVLDKPSAEAVTALAYKHLLAGVRNPRSLLMKDPAPPKSDMGEEFVKFGPFYLEKGPLAVDLVEDYILTPSVETKLIDLARIILTRKFPVLIEGPTSSGKTSSVEYLARRTGHRFVRINNHEHTDIQEYIGSYVSDSKTGKLVYKDGLLVRALRQGEWIVLDELNLAPTDVLEALNRLLDDNRELVIPETQEVIKPHPSFMLFATQNPPGLYAGRKVLSRAFRNRFLEVHFDDVPQAELESILCQRCRIAPSYAARVVAVFRELRSRRQLGRVFESKHAYATLRDLFRWAGRDAVSVQELAENGYMLLAERARRVDDRKVVKEVIEAVLNVRVDEAKLYNLHALHGDAATFLGCPIPDSSQLIWTNAMQRLFILISRALRFNEPVLLVGGTGCGKTSVCQVYAEVLKRQLYTVNCHQNTETADIIGGLRPVRNRSDDSPLFEWRDGPLVEAMRGGDVFLLDEISLADDSVLERLNSVLEPTRKIVLAERGGEDLESSSIQAHTGFKLVATMNPGGDYGKKELSPALRNRFTEIWVPSVDDRQDLELIVGSSWKHEILKPYTSAMLDFTEWLSTSVGDKSLCGLRDIIAWVLFSNAAVHPSEAESMSADEIFNHAAHMTFLDGLGSLPQLSAYSNDAIRRLRSESQLKLREFSPSFDLGSTSTSPFYDPAQFVQLGSFAIPRGPLGSTIQGFNLQAPTTQDNAMRVIRACQLTKPILLEGSPGVGKTSLIAALAKLSGFHLCRINLSDQTDLMDLFGSDLPIEGGGPGALEWKDSEFLKALREGHWVLLDEMNLAPQSVLEGLNAVLDHRGTVYIPELGRSFTRHPSFRIFAAQNPLNQGGGRKGLPKSFVNRFTKVYIDELSAMDLLLVCRSMFPSHDPDMLRAMIAFNTLLNEEVCVKKTFAREGAPWEFNLRDILRWGTLMNGPGPTARPEAHLHTIYLHRFRNDGDRARVQSIFHSIFGDVGPLSVTPYSSISPSHMRLGQFTSPRNSYSGSSRPGSLLHSQVLALESAGLCVEHSWLSIITGSSNSGKTELVRKLANICGVQLQEVSINSATDTMDILGSFEQVNQIDRASSLVHGILGLIKELQRSAVNTNAGSPAHINTLSRFVAGAPLSPEIGIAAQELLHSLTGLETPFQHRKASLLAQLGSLQASSTAGCFEWKDGPLVRAIQEGHWLLLDGANLCNPSVLDRLNSLCEPHGVLTLSERGHVNGGVVVVSPHTNFRLFMCVDPQYGELSRAMRNRGVEIFLHTWKSVEDQERTHTHLRLPASIAPMPVEQACREYAVWSRGLVNSTKGELTYHALSSSCSSDQHSELAPVAGQIQAIGRALHDSTCSADACLSFVARTSAPTHRLYLARLLSTLNNQYKKLDRLHALLRQLSPVDQAVSKLRQSHCQTWGVPLSFLYAQPFDFYLTCPKCVECVIERSPCSPHYFLHQVIQLAVTLFVEINVSNNTQSTHQQLAKMTDVHQRVFREIHNVIEASQRVSESLFEDIALKEGDCLDLVEDVTLALKSLQNTRHLRRAIQSVTIDFSTAQTVSDWFAEELLNCPPRFADLSSRTQSLQVLVSLSSGFGLAAIWETLLQEQHASVSNADIRQLDSFASSLPDGSDVYNIRRQTLSLMSLQLLPTTRTNEQSQELHRLFKELEPRLLSASAITQDSESSMKLSSALLDLRLLAAISPLDHNMNRENSHLTERAIILASKDIRRSLLPAVSLQHLYWVASTEASVHKSLSTVHLRWLEDICGYQGSGEIPHGPSSLLSSTNLCTVISLCERRRNTLHGFREFESAISSLIQTSLICTDIQSNRLQQLQGFLLQSVLLITSCFQSSFDSEVAPAVSALCHRPILQSAEATQAFIALVGQSRDHHLVKEFQTHLQPTISAISEQNQSRHSMISRLGRCWISLSRFLLSLYVPDSPIDPAAKKGCSLEYWQNISHHIASEIRLLSAYEKSQTGNESNSVIRHLKACLDQAVHLSTGDIRLPSRPDVSHLHIFWKEVTQFRDHVLGPDQIDDLLHMLEAGDDVARQREAVVQQSIAGFYHRLDKLYADYADISLPIRLSLLYMRFGLGIVHHCGWSSIPYNQLEGLIAFPTIRGSSLLLQTSKETSLSLGAAQVPLLRLSAAALEVSSGIDKELYALVINVCYEQIVRLWLIDRTKEAELAKTNESLYRSKTVESEDVGDAALEEQEFLTMFPSFEDVFDSDVSHNEANKTTANSSHINATAAQQVISAHNSLFPASPLPGHTPASSLFQDHRDTILKSLVTDHATTLPEAMDNDSLPYQLSLLHCRSTQLLSVPATPSFAFNFYSDPNVTQARRAAEVVESLKLRIQQLIAEWPDQMVLQHLRDRCTTLLKLDIQSPVAKILSAVEQLLIQTTDWEMYANRDNSLKLHQQSLTTLVVDWRRLELSCWRELLAAQSAEFASGISDWWFRMYDAVVRGPLDAFYEGNESESGKFDDYLDSLIPLLDDFLRSSPLGQFQSRLELLRSFVDFTTLLSSTKYDEERAALDRVCTILVTTWTRFNVYLPKILSRLSSQRSPLEDEIKKFIKLASWKDVNVQALKASAVRSHHQLYKIVRKFRGVLRQPTQPFLQPEPANAPDLTMTTKCVNSSQSFVDQPFPSFTAVSPGPTTAEHLLNLDTTFRRFRSYIGDPIHAFIDSRCISDIESLATEIITTSNSLSQQQAPKGISSEKRQKAQKALLVRKRKAWSELLKELKRGGLSSNVKPDVLQRQSNLRWLREQKPIAESIQDDGYGGKTELYLHRLLWLLPDLRSSLAQHHSDLTNQELHRGVMLLESAFGVALEARSSLAVTVKRHHGLRQTYKRLQMIAASPPIVSSGCQLLDSLQALDTLTHRLVHALQELSQAIGIYNDLQEGGSRISFDFIKELQELQSEISSRSVTLRRVSENIKLTSCPILLSDEYQTLTGVEEFLQSCTDTLSRWYANQPRLRYVLQPLSSWFTLEHQKLRTIDKSDGTEAPSSNDLDTLIDTLLLNVQAILAEMPDSAVDDADRDSYIRDDHRSIRKLTQLLKVEALSDRLNETVSCLAGSSEADVGVHLARILPFLDAYLHLVEEQLNSHGSWAKAMMKLTYVLCSVMSTLAKQGFCRPPDEEEGNAEGQTETVEGVGLGEGTGENNVSKEIEDESQVEGLQGEDDQDEGERDKGEDDNDAIEMGEDMGGRMEDVPDDQSGADDESGSEDDADLDEDVGDLDKSDPNVVDEKLWGDEEGPKGAGKEDDKTHKDHAEKESEGKSEMVAKEKDEPNQKKDAQGPSTDSQDQPEETEEPLPDEDGDDGEQGDASGAPMDDFIPDANTLDLPDDMDLDLGEEQQEGKEEHMDDGDELNEEEDDMKMDQAENEGPSEDKEQEPADGPGDAEEEAAQEQQPAAADEQTGAEDADQPENSAVAKADVGQGGEASAAENTQHDATGESSSAEQKSAQKGSTVGDSSEEKQDEQSEQEPKPTDQPPEGTQDNIKQDAAGSSAGAGSQQGPAPARRDTLLETNPLRNLGDALKEVRKHFDEILERQDDTSVPQAHPADTDMTSKLEYLRPDEADQDMQALGAAQEEQVAKLHDLHITEGDAPVDDGTAPMDVDIEMESFQPPEPASHLPPDPSSVDQQETREGAIVPQSDSLFSEATAIFDPNAAKATEEADALLDEDVELELKKWQSSGCPDEGAEHIWRLYGSLTHDLAYALCEQLRLILEPTLATRLKGDYRTGKRLNMKKIVSYIASDFTKDKIWLRRTKPSQREYQVLISLDDSRSMAESHSIHLAYETLALVSRALTRLEAGDIAIAKFGKTVDILHGFDDGPFTDQTGSNVVSAFRFNQEATDVLSLVETTLKALELARERRSSSSAAELWQLEIIISDGICQDHDKLRTALRKAEAQKVMIVFIIVDSLHSAVPPTQTQTQQAESRTAHAPKTAVDHSILSMTNAKLKNVDGRIELETERYLDSFPFEYYVILRNVEALPEVLSSTLKQFFERLSSDM